MNAFQISDLPYYLAIVAVLTGLFAAGCMAAAFEASIKVRKFMSWFLLSIFFGVITVVIATVSIYLHFFSDYGKETPILEQSVQMPNKVDYKMTYAGISLQELECDPMVDMDCDKMPPYIALIYVGLGVLSIVGLFFLNKTMNGAERIFGGHNELD